MFNVFKRTTTPDPRGFLQDDPVVPRVKRTYKKRKTQVAGGARQKVLNAIIARNGRKTSEVQIARATGYSYQYINFLILQMLRSGTIRRTGNRGKWRYEVKHQRVNKRRVSSTKPVSPPTTKPQTVAMPEVRISVDAVDKVLGFISRHEDEVISQLDIARGSGTTPIVVWRAVKKLEADKAIVRSLPIPRQGTRYWLTSSLETGPNREQKPVATAPAQLEAVSSEVNLHATIETLVWRYMKECKQTDILLFLKWLQQNSK